MKCENCDQEHDGMYASGRFCSSKCSRSFATSKNRTEITRKMRETSSVTRTPAIVQVKCSHCDKSFIAAKGRKRKFCSSKCSTTAQMSDPKNKEHLSKIAIARIEVNGSWYGKKSFFQHQDSNIRCDSVLELTCLEWFCKNHNVTGISRSKLWLNYEMNGKHHRYNPDFEIRTKEEMFLVEVMSTRQGKHDTWQDYIDRKAPKLKVLQTHCDQSGEKLFVFDQTVDYSLYRSILQQQKMLNRTGDANKTGEHHEAHGLPESS